MHRCHPIPSAGQVGDLTEVLQGEPSVRGHVDKEHHLPRILSEGDVLVPIDGQRPVVIDGAPHGVVAFHLWGAGCGAGLGAVTVPRQRWPPRRTRGTCHSSRVGAVWRCTHTCRCAQTHPTGAAAAAAGMFTRLQSPGKAKGGPRHSGDENGPPPPPRRTRRRGRTHRGDRGTAALGAAR